MIEDLVKVKYHEIIKNTGKATLFLFIDKEIWIPNKLYKFMEGKYIKLPSLFAREKKLKSFNIKSIYYKPKNIQPIFNQESIKELVL